MSIKILSWNIWNGKYVSEVIAFLKTSRADIIGLQEVTQDIDGANNIAQGIADQLGYEWAYTIPQRYKKNGKLVDWGNAILSKYKIVTSKTHELSKTNRRTALEAHIQLPNTILHVFSTHLIHTHQKESSIQNLQADNLLKVFTKEPTILMGDFNAIPESLVVKKVSQVLRNTDNKLLPTWSVYPEGCKVCEPQSIVYKLDYIFVSHDIQTQSFTVEKSKGSDHLPISTEVVL